MYLTLIILPLLGSIASGFFGRKIGVTGSHIITSISVIITTILSVVVFIEVGINNIPVSLTLFRWIDSESLNVLWEFRFDSLTVSMLIPVLIVSSLVHIYSIGYMNGDPHNQRFFSYLSLFTFMMIILVTANNFLLMFVGWEGVGVCSYLLVNFWYTRIAANQSSISALLTNRVGDCFLTVGMFAMLWTFGNIDYSTIFSLAPFINENIVTIIGICLLIGAMAKSSQVGLHVWLPMAMEGPTPVSALIHAATMVTAGVYLLMRCSPLIEYSSTVLLLCLWLGAITTVFSSLIGLFQQDIKKVIAYSTMSQLGMMVIAVGLSSYNIALFHLVNHAFYKALLFLGAGSVIHAVSDNQDFRKYGGLKPFLPLTYSVMFIASLSLVAFPFMTGFYSKDFILETSYGQYSFSGTIVYFIAVIAAMFTTLYSVKVLYLTFITKPNGSLVDYKHVHESDIFMSVPLIILAIFSIFFGFIAKDMFIGVGSDFFSDNALFILPSNEILLDTEFAVATLFKLLPLILTVTLSILFMFISEFLPKNLIRFKLSYIGYNIFSFFNQRFYIELLYNKYITNLILKLGGQTSKVLDKGSVEFFGPYGLEKIFISLSNKLSKLDTGVVTSYALYVLVGSVLSVIFANIPGFGPFLIVFILTSLFLSEKSENSLENFNVSNYKNKSRFNFKREFSTSSKLCSVKKDNKNKFFNLKNLKVIIITALCTAIFSFIFRYIIYRYFDLNIFDIINYPVITFGSLFTINCFRIVFKSWLEAWLSVDLATITYPNSDTSSTSVYSNTRTDVLAMDNKNTDPGIGSSKGVKSTSSDVGGSADKPIDVDSYDSGSLKKTESVQEMLTRWKRDRDAVIKRSVDVEELKNKSHWTWRSKTKPSIYTPIKESEPDYNETLNKISKLIVPDDPNYYKDRDDFKELGENALREKLAQIVKDSHEVREELKSFISQTDVQQNLSPYEKELERRKRAIDSKFYKQIDKVVEANLAHNTMKFQEGLNDLASHDYSACAIKMLNWANRTGDPIAQRELDAFVDSSHSSLHSLNYNYAQMLRISELLKKIEDEKKKVPIKFPVFKK